MAVKKTVDKWKKKKWFELIAPKEFDSKSLGETPAEKSALVVGRTVLVPVDELTGNRKLRHIIGKFKVKEVKESRAFTEIMGFEINRSYLRRMIRRKASKIESVVTGTTKDGKKVRVKGTIISARNLEKRKEKEIRKILSDEIRNEIPKKNLEQLMHEMIFGILSAEIFKKADTVDRLKRVEIVKARLMEGK